MSKSIAVIGCGWLGLPLAVSLIEAGYQVKGSTTSQEKMVLLENQGIQPYLISLFEEELIGHMDSFLEEVDTIIINIPPKLRGGGNENYVKKMQLLHQSVLKAALRRVIFVSSTSVYGDAQGVVTEATEPKPATESGKQLLASERIFLNDINLKTTIIRFGGLIGPDRHPVSMLSGRRNLAHGNARVNLIHLNDCIAIIQSVLKFEWWGEILNGVYPEHPLKKMYYTSKAKELGLQAPDYKEDNTEDSKIIVPMVLLNVKNYRFTTSL